MIRRVPHFHQVDRTAIKAQFFDNRRHRASLFLPYLRRSDRTLCIIGQNPSDADAQHADKTVRYLEEFIYRTQPKYSALLMLNLYSRVDTNKSATGCLLNARCAELLATAIDTHDDFLLVFGRTRVEGAYNFPEREAAVLSKLNSKTVLKIDISTDYCPHPGNPLILYRNFGLPIVRIR